MICYNPGSDVLSSGAAQTVHFAVSPGGALIHAPGGQTRPRGELTWLEPDGRLTSADPEENFRSVASARVSPDGAKLAIVVSDDRYDIHVLDIETGSVSVVANDKAWETWPIWSTESDRLLYSSAHESTLNLYTVDLAGNRSEALLPPGDAPRFASSWASDWVAWDERGEGGLLDAWLLDLNGDGTPVALAATRANESSAKLSPDGRWVAFVTDVSGRPEVHIASMPPTGESRQVSRNGGSTVGGWTSDSRYVFYFNQDSRREMRVRIDDVGRPGAPEPFTAADPERFEGEDSDKNTGRVIGVLREQRPEISWLVVRPDWRAELARRMADGR